MQNGGSGELLCDRPDTKTRLRRDRQLLVAVRQAIAMREDNPSVTGGEDSHAGAVGREPFRQL